MLLAISEAVGPQYVALQLHKKAAAHKNPKVLRAIPLGETETLLPLYPSNLLPTL